MDKQYNPDGFIPKHGGYERLITYQKSEVFTMAPTISAKSISMPTTAPSTK